MDKSLEEKRDEASIVYTESHKNKPWMRHLFYDSFSAGWDACAKEYEQENAELKRQLEIAKEALRFYADKKTWGLSGTLIGKRWFMSLTNYGPPMNDFDVFKERNYYGYSNEPDYLDYFIAGRKAREALKNLESAGEC